MSNLPAYLKARLEKARNQAEEREAETEVDAEDVLSEDSSEETADGLSESEAWDGADESDVADGEGRESNDDKAWKGRLKKVQEENERLKAAVQNGSFAAAKLLEMQEREKQKDAELAELRSRLDGMGAQKPGESDDEGGLFSEDERDTLSMEFGDEALNVLENKLKGLRGKGVDDDVRALREELRRRDEESKRALWFETMRNQIPEIQGLLQANSGFLAFLQEKRDFSGRTALDVVEQAGNDLDVGKIPLIRSWIDEFKGGNEKVQRKASARPLGGGGHTHEPGRKRKAGDKEWAMRNRLKNTGRRAELEKLIEQFDWS